MILLTIPESVVLLVQVSNYLRRFYHGDYAEMIENQTHMAYNLGFFENDETDQTHTSI